MLPLSVLMLACREDPDSSVLDSRAEDSVETGVLNDPAAEACIDSITGQAKNTALKLLIDPEKSYEGGVFIAQITEDPNGPYSPYRDLTLIGENPKGQAFMNLENILPGTPEMEALGKQGFDVDGQKDFFVRGTMPGAEATRIWGTDSGCMHLASFYSCEGLGFNGDWASCKELETSYWEPDQAK